MTEPAAWLQRVQDQMGNGSDILLLLSQIDQAKSNALAKLCHAYHYSQDSEMDLSEEYRSFLGVNDYAAKENGIGIDMVFVLHPECSRINSRRLSS
jgi:hypothetical protein